MWRMHSGMGWWMVLGGAFVVLFWSGAIALVVWGVRHLARSGGAREASRGKETPLDIAKARYARGEITKEEFEQIKKDLSS